MAQNEAYSSYLDAGRRFCNQSQRYHRYAVKPAAQETYTKKPIKTADPAAAVAAAHRVPETTLQKNVKKQVIVRLKNEVEYKGKMSNVDSYMNLIMTEAE